MYTAAISVEFSLFFSGGNLACQYCGHCDFSLRHQKPFSHSFHILVHV